jgi:hypothetical protein
VYKQRNCSLVKSAKIKPHGTDFRSTLKNIKVKIKYRKSKSQKVLKTKNMDCRTPLAMTGIEQNNLKFFVA